MPKPAPIEQQWSEFSLLVYPPGTPEVQRIECRRAFFAGAVALFGLLLRELDPSDDDATPKDLALMDSIAAEIKRYTSDLRRGRA